MLRNVFGLLSLALLSSPVLAQDAANPCTAYITSLPFDINSPGHYCLKANLTTDSFRAVNIQSSDVTLNCRNRSMTTTNRTGGTDGVVIMGDLSNVTVQNCTVNNFDRGINGNYRGTNLQVLNNHVDNAISAGISVWGNQTRVVNNRVTNTQHRPDQQSVGIHLLPFAPETSAVGQELINNVVAGSRGNNQIIGFEISGSTAPRVVNNHVIDLQPVNGGWAVGMWLSGWAQGATTTDVSLINNSFSARDPVVQGLWGQPKLCRGNLAVGLSQSGFANCLSSVDNTEIP